jgi:CheY-like chemotaxis protein
MRPDKSSILIAEDNLNDVFLLKNAFQEAAPKMRINVVGNGEELIGYLQAKPAGGPSPIPALILLDLKMPKVDGFEALRWIRNQPQLKRLLVIVFSSSGESGQINRAYDLGANSYLMKPFDYHQLTDLIRKLLIYWVDTNLAPTFSSGSADLGEPVARDQGNGRPGNGDPT